MMDNNIYRTLSYPAISLVLGGHPHTDVWGIHQPADETAPIPPARDRKTRDVSVYIRSAAVLMVVAVVAAVTL